MSHFNKDILIDLMAECADQMLAGASVAACLERHPEHAAALEPLLTTASAVHDLRHVPARSAEVAAQRRAQFLAAARAPVQPAAKNPLAQLAGLLDRLRDWVAGPEGWPSAPRTMPAGLVALLVIVILSGLLLTGVVSTAASVLPGDILYPVKIATERVQVLFTFDQAARADLRAELAERRTQEARAVVDLGRRVANVPLEGVTEAITDDTWQVSGLTVIITQDSKIIGTPAIGARVQGLARAPGDGSLIVRYVEIEAPAQPLIPSPTPSQVPTATQPVPTATATSTETVAPVDAAVDRPAARPAPIDEPTERPTETPAATATATQTLTHTPTATATPTAAATLTPTPAPPREQVKGRIYGYVQRIVGGWWTINGVTVETNADTRFVGNPRVGSKVEAIIEIKPNDAAVGLTITELEPPGGPPEPLEFTSVVQAINGSLWTIGSFQVQVTGDTQLENNPGIGDLVEVKAERYANGEVRALRITAIRDVVVYLDGIIKAMAGDAWQIGERTVIVTAETQIIGEAAIGATVQVQAKQMPDGRLIAQIIAVTKPAPTSSPTISAAAATPTITSTPEPTATATPTATLTPEPTETITPASTPATSETPASDDTETTTPTPAWSPTATDATVK